MEAVNMGEGEKRKKKKDTVPIEKKRGGVIVCVVHQRKNINPPLPMT